MNTDRTEHSQRYLSFFIFHTPRAQDMIKPRYVELAGHFFEEVFSGMTFDNLLLTEVYPPKALEFERELKLICEHAWN